MNGLERGSRKVFLLAAVLFVMTIAAHAPALRGGFIWDDDRYVTENPLLKSADGLRAIWFKPSAFPQYYPMVLTSFWVESRVWGLEPLGYHATNVMLHALNACLVFVVLRSLAVPGAWLAAAIFAVHPVHVESVAWVTERKNLLSAFLVLLSVAAYCRFVGWFGPRDPAGESGRSRKTYYGISLVLFLLALLSKTTVCTMPAAMCVLHWAKQGRVTRRAVLRLTPFFALGAVLGLVTVYMEKVFVGARGAEWDFSAMDRLIIAGRALWFYLFKLLWPAPLIFSYPRWEIDDRLWWQYLLPLSAAAAVVLLWAQRRRLGRWPLAGVLIFAGTLVPALGFFDVFPMRYTFVADHFQYLSSIGIIALFPGLLARIVPRRNRDLPAPPALLPALAAPALLLLAALTWNQALIYRSAETLWRDTIRKNPGSWMAAVNLGVLLVDRGETREAASCFRRALELHSPNSKALYGLGRVAQLEGRVDEAIDFFRQSLQVTPAFIPPRFDLATALARRGDFQEARSRYLEILRIQPDHVKAYANLGTLSAQQGAWTEALSYFNRALQLEPGNPRRHNSVALAFMSLGRLPEAEAGYRESLRMNPDDVETRTQLGAVLLRLGKTAAAAEYLSVQRR